MNVLREDENTVHLPTRDDKWPFDVLDYPFPLCSMVGMDATFIFVDDPHKCETCDRKQELHKHYLRGQIEFAI